MLTRFLDAQSRDYAQALAELRSGRKRTHWIWYVLPQVRGLGMSQMSKTYGIESLTEAREYLAHPTLGSRLRECVAAIDGHNDRRIEQILGDIDAIKYRSCLTLFKQADETRPSVFAQALEVFFDGCEDQATLELLAQQQTRPRGA
jgi:uncharacterized protein (DUF1810 family)